MPRSIYLSLGSNIEPGAHLHAALESLGALGQITAVSDLYRTAPVGVEEQPDFYNLALALRTEMPALLLLRRCQEIERRLGRRRRARWGPREIDIDLLFCQPFVRLSHPQLELPHPGLAHRAFVLVPLLQIGEPLPLRFCRSLQAHAWAVRSQRVDRLGPLPGFGPGSAP